MEFYDSVSLIFQKAKILSIKSEQMDSPYWHKKEKNIPTTILPQFNIEIGGIET